MHSANVAALALVDPASPGSDTHFQAQLVQLVPALRARAGFFERSPAAAEDLVQDTIERALRNRWRFKAGTNLKGWLLCIMHNLFTDRWRERHRQVPDEAEPAATAPDPEGPHAWELACTDDVLAVLGELSEPLRAVVELRFFEHLSYAELAVRVGVPVATVGTRLVRARARLRVLITRRLAERHRASEDGVTPTQRPAGAAGAAILPFT
jgi:RNA polymerase sigma-70 factor (ECF subfamily)